MLGMNTSQFASAETLAPYLYFRGSNWKTKLETDNLEEECKSNEECKSKVNKFCQRLLLY